MLLDSCYSIYRTYVLQVKLDIAIRLQQLPRSEHSTSAKRNNFQISLSNNSLSGDELLCYMVIALRSTALEFRPFLEE